MTEAKLPVPFGFTITTEACKYGKNLPANVTKEIDEGVAELEKTSGKKFGDPANPLLVSVRSGAAISMPGMMDTVLNLGLNPITKAGLATKTNNPRFAADSYRRFIQMFGNVVLEIEHKKFEEELDVVKKV
jgi:pyruvate,orthophosphate dikinase